MKTNFKIAFMIFFAICISACEKEDQTQEPEAKLELELEKSLKGGGIIGAEFPQAQQQVMETFGEIAQSIIDNDMDKLISFHAYGPKFTEFKNGQYRNGGEANEQYERDVFGSVFKVEKFGADDGWKMVHEHHSPLTA